MNTTEQSAERSRPDTNILPQKTSDDVRALADHTFSQKGNDPAAKSDMVRKDSINEQNTGKSYYNESNQTS
jgi:hypothetical protein